ncbi:hypothetical protein [Sphingobacterium corticibacterium]|uniref:Uncharacterized protein n=1 Tax=Sphingobacterium corticibacterium TaxID=2484746 RepID=A0A4Q6XLA3_9SPHI|nr:hypothetical protein [Sphingobacterium corticibacterium]RZF60245.1 hypothetical protein EWE74_14150 [Sphingobacterium corticibacterium]
MKEKKYPFTPIGVGEKITDLYISPLPEIEAEAVAVSSNFCGWLTNNFDLSAEQISYLQSLGEDFATENGNDLAFAFRNRLAVTLTKGDISVRTSKFIRKEKSVSTVSEPEKETVVSGDINYFIS